MGVRTRGVLCLTNHISSLPLEGCGNERPADSQVCNTGPCENRIEWFTGPWSQVWRWRKDHAWLKGMLSGLANYVETYSDFTLTCKDLFSCLNFFLQCVIESIWSLWPSALQSVAQAASRGRWCVWWSQMKDSPLCHCMSAPPWSGPSASRAATSRPVEQSGITLTGVVWVQYETTLLFRYHVLPTTLTKWLMANEVGSSHWRINSKSYWDKLYTCIHALANIENGIWFDKLHTEQS